MRWEKFIPCQVQGLTAAVIKTEWYWQMYRQRQIECDSLKINPCINGNLLYDEGDSEDHWEKKDC